jgi:flagellar L-ring protein precursor FlgH
MNRLLREAAASAIAVLVMILAPQTALAQSQPLSSLGADQVARAPGDSLTVLVFETFSASNLARSGADRRSQIGLSASSDSLGSESASLDRQGRFDGTGRTERSGRMVATITTVVEEVMANGDMLVSGVQSLMIGGERSTIRVRGRVRRADIAANNTVPSNRLAGAVVEVIGDGFAARSARPGLIDRALTFLGLL